MSSNAQPPINPYAAQQNILVERLQILLAMLYPTLRADAMLALGVEGKLLSSRQPKTTLSSSALPDGSWALLTLFVAQYVSPNLDPQWASTVAVALECLI